jgi:ribonuclease Z
MQCSKSVAATLNQTLKYEVTMKLLIFGLILVTLSFPGTGPLMAQSDTIKVTLLGTGTPQLNPRRMSYSTLVEAGGEVLMFDAGRAAMLQAKKSGANLKNFDKLFLTHLHSDHVVGIPDVWLTGFLAPLFRATPLKVWGPKGVTNLTAGLRQAYDFDVNTRIAQYGGKRAEGMEFDTTEIHDGLVYENEGIKVSAFEVEHLGSNTSFGYKIEYEGRSVVLSGDTIYSENLIRHAKGVDLLVHQVGYAPEAAIRENKVVARIITLHTQPQQVARIFTEAKPKLAVFSHIAVFKVQGPDLSPAGEQAMMDVVRQAYDGAVILGQDLMAFEIGDTVIQLP